MKSAGAPWRRARAGLGLFLHDEMLKENIDGEALLWAHERLMRRPEQRRILVVVSDGTPMDEATAAANGFEYLDDHLHQVVRAIEARSPVRLAAIGIGHDVSRVYTNATKIAKVDQLGFEGGVGVGPGQYVPPCMFQDVGQGRGSGAHERQPRSC